jgi:hypothetical protein
MVELTFVTSTLEEKRTVEGELKRTDEGLYVVEESAESRPNWRIESDRTVTLISPKADVTLTGFGVSPRIEGVCLRHDVDYRELPGNGCPMCDEERRIEEAEVEQMQRTTWVDDPHDPHGYRDDPGLNRKP